MNLAESLLRWYDANRRDLPWRRTRDPYRIWVSEIMLQQTRVAAVLEHYERFIARYPNAATLAAADIDEVLTAWRGLGYYRRARNLHAAARIIVREHAGIFPQTYEAVRALPGVGDYTAAAVCAIAYDEPVAAVDGNVVRVVARLDVIETPTPSSQAVRLTKQRVIAMMPLQRAGDFTQALMELGALVCTPKGAHCNDCPWQSQCKARAAGRQDELPARKPRIAQQVVERTVALIVRNGAVLLRRRPDDGLLGGMWEFPGVDRGASFATLDLDVKLAEELLRAEHVFTHLRWRMRVHCASLIGKPSSDCRWVAAEALDDYAIPSAFRAVRRYLDTNIDWRQPT